MYVLSQRYVGDLTIHREPKLFLRIPPSPTALACNRIGMSAASIRVQLIIVHHFPQDGNSIYLSAAVFLN
jgi:hypothetical protein